MKRAELESKINKRTLTIIILGALWLTACSAATAESKIDPPSLNTQIKTCIYNSPALPHLNESVCKIDSPPIEGVAVTLIDVQNNPHHFFTDQNGQLIVDPERGGTFFSSTDYPSWAIDYTQTVGDYCFAYAAIIEDLSNPTYLEYQYAFTKCP